MSELAELILNFVLEIIGILIDAEFGGLNFPDTLASRVVLSTIIAALACLIAVELS